MPPTGTPATGTVFLADSTNHRVNTYSLDGSGPASIGSAATFKNIPGSVVPMHVAVDSRGILYADNGDDNGTAPFGDDEYPVERYDTQGVNGARRLPRPDRPRASMRDSSSPSAPPRAPSSSDFRRSTTTADLPFNATQNAVQSALRALPSVGATNVLVAGGPGDAGGSRPLHHHLRRWPWRQRRRPDSPPPTAPPPLSGGSGASVATVTAGQVGLPSSDLTSLAVDPDTDGGGADTDVLYAARGSVIQQFGPLNPAGLSAPPTPTTTATTPTGYKFIARQWHRHRAHNRPPLRRLGRRSRARRLRPRQRRPLADRQPRLLRQRHRDLRRVPRDDRPQRPTRHPLPLRVLNRRLHIGLALPEVFLGVQTDPQAIDRAIDPPPIGLQPNTLYHVRLLAVRKFATPIITNELTFTTLGVPPLAETAGAPVRTTTTAQINGRVTPAWHRHHLSLRVRLDRT